MKIMLYEAAPERSPILCATLERLGHQVVDKIANAGRLCEAVRVTLPDAIIVATDTLSDDTLEQLRSIIANWPRPVVIFTRNARRDSIRAAIRAGVIAYIVDGLEAERIESILETACVQFEAFQSLQTELAQTRGKLNERKLLDRAKGILMQEKNVTEDEAYRLLRKLAMDRNVTVGTVAEQVITYAKLLG